MFNTIVTVGAALAAIIAAKAAPTKLMPIAVNVKKFMGDYLMAAIANSGLPRSRTTSRRHLAFAFLPLANNRYNARWMTTKRINRIKND